MKYWLSRDEKAAPEGPYPLQVILSMRDRRQLGETALVCPDGQDYWRTLDTAVSEALLAAQTQPRFQDNEQSFRDRLMAKRCSTWVSILCVCMVLLACIPGLGLVGVAILTTVFVISGTVLSVIQMTKGGIFGGIVNLLAVWVVTPALVVGAQAAGWVAGGVPVIAAALGSDYKVDNVKESESRLQSAGRLPADLNSVKVEKDRFTGVTGITCGEDLHIGSSVKLSAWGTFESDPLSPRFILHFRRVHDDWKWLKYHDLYVLTDGEPLKVRGNLDTDTLGGGTVYEAYSIKLDLSDVDRILLASTVLVKIGLDEFELHPEELVTLAKIRAKYGEELKRSGQL